MMCCGQCGSVAGEAGRGVPDPAGNWGGPAQGGVGFGKLTLGRSCVRSECHELPMMAKKAKALGGTVRSWALSVASAFVQCEAYLMLTSFEAEVGNDGGGEVSER